MSKNISELLPDVLLSASGCPPMVATQALSSAVREFLETTSAWKVWVPAVDTVASQATYAFPNHLMDPAEAWARTTSIDLLRWGPTGREIPFMTTADLQDADPQWRTREAGIPSAWTYEVDNGVDGGAVVRLYPIPSEVVTDAIEARLVISTHTYSGVGATATDAQPVLLPNEIFHKFRDALVCGALARLYAIPRRDWTDYQAARYHRDMFERAMVSATSEADVDYNDVGLTVNYGGY